MSTDLAQASGRPSRVDVGTFLRGVLFVAAYSYSWITLYPFPDLSDPIVLQPAKSLGLINQSVAVILGILSISFIYSHDWRRLKPIFSPLFIAAMLWCGFSGLLSPHADIAIRRYVLTLIIMTIAAATLLLPRDERHFGGLIAAATLLVLFVCYAGVVLFPLRSVHQFMDLNEPQLAGAWRGSFTHKNDAGSAMAMIALLGLYVARTRNLVVGGFIVGASLVFLCFSLSKTSIALLPVVLLMTSAVTAMRGAPARGLLVIGGLVLFNVFTIGSAFSTPISDFLASLGFNSSYTQRNDVWRFAVAQLALRPLTGHGFQAFWRMNDVIYNGGGTETWAIQSPDGHNDYLDLALTIGVPGLILVVLWLVVSPIGDIGRGLRTGNDPALTALFIQLWLFGIFRGCLETAFFTGGSPHWFMMSVAIFGLRLQGSSALIPNLTKNGKNTGRDR